MVKSERVKFFSLLFYCASLLLRYYSVGVSQSADVRQQDRRQQRQTSVESRLRPRETDVRRKQLPRSVSGEAGAKVGLRRQPPPPKRLPECFVFFWAILWYSQNGDNQRKDIATFGHKINMKTKFKNKHPSMFLATQNLPNLNDHL